MSSLLLVRHGQASFLAEDYDQLGPRGVEQARSLGRYCVQSGLSFHEIFTGPRQRQRETARLVAEGYRAAQLTAPPIQESPSFDEHQLEQLIRHHRKQLPLPDIEASMPEQDARPLDASAESIQRQFYRLLQTVATLWLQNHPGTAAVESWPAFKQRVLGGLTRILQGQGRGRRIAIFTSAGVIGVALQHALGCSDLQALEMSWRLRNSSLTEFVFSGSRFTLDSFNGLPHLTDRQMWTHI